MMEFKNKTVIVTGGANGMGASHARSFASEGANVVIADVAQKAGEELANELGENVVFMKLDVTSEENWQKVLNDTLERFGSLDILINNAGICIMKDINKISIEEFDRTIAINTRGVFLGIKLAAPYLKQTKGNIVNVSSIAGILGEQGSIAYAASKAAVIAMTKTSALELASSGIRVNAILPGAINTAMGDAYAEAEENQGVTFDMGPMDRAGEVDEVSKLVLFLTSPKASFITGSSVVVDGGKSIDLKW